MPNETELALINGGANLLGQSASIIAQSSINKKTRKWNEKMHALQRSEALADYQMQNQYNHPSSIMARLREAKLNPNLVYGNGTSVESAAPVKPSGVESWNPQAPKIDLGSAAGSAISAFYDTQMRQAQIDNLRTQNGVLEQEKLLKMAQITNTMESATNTGERTKGQLLSNELSKFLFDTKIALAKENLRNLTTRTDLSVAANERADKTAASSIALQAEQILSQRAMRAKNASEVNEINQRIQNLKKDQKLKELDIQLKRSGVQPGDPLWQRILARFTNLDLSE